jgi:hypothetical protein
MTLIFALSQNSLEIYQDKYELENLIETVKSDQKVLQLHGKFESIWAKIFENYVSKATNLVLIIKPKASFTDTRIISIWCRSHCMFETKVELQILTLEQFESQNNDANKEIIYSQAPKIGSK